MKNLIYILGLIGVLSSTIISCTPDDKNLNRPVSGPNTQGTPAKNLRVGTLGQTIWAVQNVEQVGSLVRYCLEMNIPVENVNSKIYKNCSINYSAATPVRINEKWKVKLELNTAGEVVFAIGDLVSGYTTVVYRTINSYLQYSNKSFNYSYSADKKLHISLESNGEIGSKVDNFKFVHQINAEGLATEMLWNFNNFEHELVLLNVGQAFNIKSNSIDLSWTSTRCADSRGVATAVEEGRDPATVTFDAVLAKSDKPKWSQKIPKCGNERGERQSSFVNFGLLFY